ncbi:hypothetical protein [Nonomuraea sp. JJY05]|jgi:protein-L-isoaspartate(D-aspartate) O-methyltransferase|uniref:hypothetical protein n=1 Tax=Nonomuraea sp. JJY05 TaxID=3350255 RepID=UPI00373EF92F
MFWRDPDRESALIEPAMRWYCPLLITHDSFAYLTIRQPQRHEAAELRWEFGTCGYGRAGAELARQLHDHVQAWDRDWRDRPSVVPHRRGSGSL